jgi:hypothetical protein
MPVLLRPVTSTAPKLAPPGAGIPVVERFFGNIIIRYLTLRSRVDVECLREAYLLTVNRSLSLAEQFANPTMQILVPRLRGLEDSSRFYSPAMVIEHVALVDSGIAETVRILASGQVPSYQVSTADVKPHPEMMWQKAVEMLATASQSFMVSLNSDFTSTATLAHPWFGGLTAWQWAQLTVIHHKIHQRQLETMLALSPSAHA